MFKSIVNEKNKAYIFLLIPIAVILCICNLCLVSMLYVYWDYNRDYLHLIGDSGIQVSSLRAALLSCYTHEVDLICAYEYGDKYYFSLTSKNFSYRRFDRPYAEMRNGKLYIVLNHTNIHIDGNMDEYMKFYINKSDFPNVRDIRLDYYLRDENGNILEHKDIPIKISVL